MTMVKKPFFYIANWKMNLHFHAAVSFCAENYEALLALAEQEGSYLILCPSYIAIEHVNNMFRDTTISIGAQNCSEHNQGAYTGEVSAQSLAEIGCRYVLVGHSERRNIYQETDDSVLQKIMRSLEHSLRPIICIGETQDEREKNLTYDALGRQLEAVCRLLATYPSSDISKSIFFAYEPVWAIGTGLVPTAEEVQQVCLWIKKTVQQYEIPFRAYVLYGGSVNGDTAPDLKKAEGVNGFLIGSASIDFQTLRKIVLS